MMCHQPVDSLPMSNSIFSGSWIGIGLGLVIVVGIVIGVTRAQGISDDVARAVERVTPTAMPTFTPNPTPTGTSPPTVTLTPLPTPTPRIHLVEGGETLEYIALRYGVRVDQLIDLNEVEDVRALSVGQPLIIPGEQELEQNPDLVPLLRVYVIEEGDTLSSISYEIGTPMEAIVAANPNLNLDLIFPGQEIIVPLLSRSRDHCAPIDSYAYGDRDPFTHSNQDADSALRATKSFEPLRRTDCTESDLIVELDVDPPSC
jgi:LysM repeat protein